MRFVSILCLLGAVQADYASQVVQEYTLSTAAVAPAQSSLSSSDQDLIKQSVADLKKISSNSTLSHCDKCKERLSYGKKLAQKRIDLVPNVFTQWCTDTGLYNSDDCGHHFGRNTVERNNMGSNFADMVSLMDPTTYDGEYYCYYMEDQCDFVEPPKIDASHLWNGTKPSKYNVAPEPGNETFYVLHVSDFHIENDYVVGGEGNCTGGMCCTPTSWNRDAIPKGYHFSDGELFENGPKDGWDFYNSTYDGTSYQKGSYIGYNESNWSPAFSYGHYKCDAPELLINSSLRAAMKYDKKLNLGVEFAIFTGDLVDHDENNHVTFDSALKAETTAFRDSKTMLGNIPMYSVLGNHDSFPYAQVAQSKYGFSNKFDWNNELMAEMWRDYGWIDYDTEQEVKSHYTGFSVTTKRGLKVIALNSNTWHMQNQYAFINMVSDYDSFGQFKFLVDELLESEKNGQRVWLMMHVPAGEDMLPTASNVLSQVIERFSPYTIAGIFNGHTHRDEFKVLYSNFNGSNTDAQTADNAIAHTWIAPSVTTYTELNPSFRFLEVDTKTHSIMNAYTYYLKLNETFTNNGTEPEWLLEYDARSAYDINWPKSSPLNATYWHEVAQQVKTSKTALQKYENYATRFSPYTYDCSSSDHCEQFYCYVSTFSIDQYVNCCKHYGISSGF